MCDTMLTCQYFVLIDNYHTLDLKSTNPLILHVALTAAILDILGQFSNSITKWILDIEKITIELTHTCGILPTNSHFQKLSPEEIKTLKKIPTSVNYAF